MQTQSPRIPALIPLLFAVAAAHSADAQLTDLGAQLLTECAAPGDCLTDDAFGSALAVGDFDGDGFADLAVGVPGETVGGDAGAGSVHIYYGSARGLTSSREQIFDQDTPGLPTAAEPGDLFGAALAVGDFDLDGFDDLAIGAPEEGLSSFAKVGSVEVLFGSSVGLTVTGYRFLSQESLPPGAVETNESGDRFGFALAAGPQGELAIAAPFEIVGGGNSGIVHQLTASTPGEPLGAGATLHPADAEAECDPAVGGFSHWGFSVLHGRFGNVPSLVIAAPQTQVETAFGGSGRLAVITGAAVECFDQNTPGILDEAGAGDRFGHALAEGDFDGDGFDDLAVGVPFEDLEAAGVSEAGIIQIIYGGPNGLTSTGNRPFNQNNFSDEVAEDGDHFGLALAAGDFDGDGHDDLAIGAPHESFGNISDSGGVNVLYGRSIGLSNIGNQTFNSNFPTGMPDAPNPSDALGSALATGDFDGNGTDDLAIGVPGEDLGAAEGAGMVTVLYGLDHETGAFGTVQFDDDAVTVSESAEVELFRVTRVGGAVVAASVELSHSGGTATPGVDFTYTSGTESWSAGNLSPSFFSIRVLEDTLDEPDETLVISLSNPSEGSAIGSPSNLTLTIVDNDVAGAISFAQPVTVFSELAGNVQVPVTRTAGAASGVTVQYATSNATATAGLDYTATSGTLTFGANETTKLIPVEILDDSFVEGREVFLVTLSNPGGGGVLGTFPVHQVVIHDNDHEIFLDGFESGDTCAWSAAVGSSGTC